MPVLMESDDRTGVGWKANRGEPPPSAAAQHATLAVVEFDAAVVHQPDYGRHASLFVSYPTLAGRGRQLSYTSWLRMRVDGSDPVFVRRGKLAIMLPAWKFSTLEVV